MKLRKKLAISLMLIGNLSSIGFASEAEIDEYPILSSNTSTGYESGAESESEELDDWVQEDEYFFYFDSLSKEELLKILDGQSLNEFVSESSTVTNFDEELYFTDFEDGTHKIIAMTNEDKTQTQKQEG